MRSLNVSPRLPGLYVAYLRLRNIIVTSDISSFLPRGQSSLNLAHIALCQLCTGIGFSRKSAVSISTFCHHVGRIIGQCSEPQMSRVTASPVIAGMTYAKTFWNRAICQFVGHSMRGYSSLYTSTVEAKRAVAVSVYSRRPVPAGVRAAGFIYLFPKAIFGWALVSFGRVSFLDGGMSGKELSRLTGYRAAQAICTGGKSRLFAASTMTKAVWYFFILRFGGMIRHIGSSPRAIGHAPGRLPRRRCFSLPELYPICGVNPTGG